MLCQFSAHLKSAVQFIGLGPNNFKGNSFRIGAATYAASLGFSDNLIKKLGRWNSDAIYVLTLSNYRSLYIVGQYLAAVHVSKLLLLP